MSNDGKIISYDEALRKQKAEAETIPYEMQHMAFMMDQQRILQNSVDQNVRFARARMMRRAYDRSPLVRLP